jgi:cysteinyl-tRNA synthetase
LLKKECVAALDDDLNISRVLSALFAAVGEFHTDIDRGRLGQAAAAAILARFHELDEVLGIMNLAPPATAGDTEIEARLAAREEARKRRDWQAADQIRDELAVRGIDITDSPAGPRWRRR